MVTNLLIRMPSCLSFKGRNYYEGYEGVVAKQYEGPPMGGGFALMSEVGAPGAPNIVPSITPIVSVRTFFPETWLFKLFETG